MLSPLAEAFQIQRIDLDQRSPSLHKPHSSFRAAKLPALHKVRMQRHEQGGCTYGVSQQESSALRRASVLPTKTVHWTQQHMSFHANKQAHASLTQDIARFQRLPDCARALFKHWLRLEEGVRIVHHCNTATKQSRQTLALLFAAITA
jgi:hypothetical protein